MQASEIRHWYCNPPITIQHNHEQYKNRISLKKHMASETAHASEHPAQMQGAVWLAMLVLRRVLWVSGKRDMQNRN